MYVVAIGWLYVTVMAAIAEGMSPDGTWLGAAMTLLGWGILPLALVLYILGTPARKRRLRAREAQRAAATPSPSPALAKATPTAHEDPKNQPVSNG